MQNILKLKFVILELKEGEALFIPKLWWHHVITLEQSISVNFWFQHIESEKLKLTKHWNHMVEYLKCIEKMEISKEKMKNVLQFYGMKVTDNDIQYYIDNPHQFMLLPQFLHTFSNGTRSPWMINLPESQQFAKEIEFKIKEWILSRIYK
jgi:dTDP-4-dehydrorhamnose 3,5-epimerase-like enzyme